MRKVWVKIGQDSSKEEEKLTLSGTKEGVKAIGKGRVILVPNDEEWKSDIPFAILALVIDDKSSDSFENNIRHRVDLLKIEEGSENLSRDSEREFMVGLDSQEITQKFQTQIEVSPYKK